MKTKTALLYSYIKPNSFVKELPILLSFNLLLVLCSYLSFTVPFSPVPITGQTFGVLLVGMVLGKTRGTAVVLAYLLEGFAGLPVFAGGSAGAAKFFGPTGGYLIGFLAAAYLVGMLADRGWDKSYAKTLISMTIGTAVVFVAGLAQLSFFVPEGTLLSMGFIPFIPGALVKIAAASAILPSVWKMLK